MARRLLDARPDRLDLRDLAYRPPLRSLPPQWPVDADIARIMDEAVAKAKAGPRPVPADVHEHVYARYR